MYTVAKRELVGGEYAVKKKSPTECQRQWNALKGNRPGFANEVKYFSNYLQTFKGQILEPFFQPSGKVTSQTFTNKTKLVTSAPGIRLHYQRSLAAFGRNDT